MASHRIGVFPIVVQVLTIPEDLFRADYLVRAGAEVFGHILYLFLRQAFGRVAQMTVLCGRDLALLDCNVVSADTFLQYEFTLFHNVHFVNCLSLPEHLLPEPAIHLLQAVHEILQRGTVVFLKQWNFAEELLFFFDLDHEAGHGEAGVRVVGYSEQSDARG